jgi:small subunit ribosomal protein S20
LNCRQAQAWPPAIGHRRRTFENMANTTSAKKATRKIARRTIINKSRRTQMRGAVRSVEEAIKSGDRDAALKAMAHAEPELMQAAQRNIIHKNNASRKVSRLAHQIAKLAKWADRNRHSSKSPAVPGFFISGLLHSHAFYFQAPFCLASYCSADGVALQMAGRGIPGGPYFYWRHSAVRADDANDGLRRYGCWVLIGRAFEIAIAIA